MVRIGILSVAHMHAKSYGNCLRQIDNAELVGIHDDQPERGKSVADELECNFFSSIDELFAKVDGVIICSENSKHKEYTLLAAEAEKHILCEKPIATTFEDAKIMIEAAEKEGVKLQIAFPCRFNTPVQEVKKLIDAESIGEILAVKGTNHGQMPGGWFIDKKLSGGGAIMDHTVHVIDLVRWFLGKEFISVYAEIDNTLYNASIDDCGILSLELENGIFMTQDPSWSRPKTFPTWGDVTLKIVGTKGIIYIDAFAQQYLVYDDQNNKIASNVWADDMNKGLILDYIEMIEQDREPNISGYDGLQAMNVALAAYKSASLNKPVVIEGK